MILKNVIIKPLKGFIENGMGEILFMKTILKVSY